MLRQEVAIGFAVLALLASLSPSAAEAGVLQVIALLLLPLVSRLVQLGQPGRAVLMAAGTLSGGALAGLALLTPAQYTQLAPFALLIATAAPPTARRIAIGLGAGVPFALYLMIALSGEDARSLLWSALAHQGDRLELAFRGLGLGVVAAGLLTLGNTPSHGPRWHPVLSHALATGCLLGACGLRLGWIASIASLKTDLGIWSEAPALVNLLKLSAGEIFYGPAAWVNSYSYSPGIELGQYALLRPFGLELSLRSHRLLGLGWQLATALLLHRGLLRALQGGLAPRLPLLARIALAAAIGCIAFSSLLSPHQHPDHALMLVLGVAVCLTLRAGAPSATDKLLLLLLPALATSLKLTGAGLGLGLVLAYAWERDRQRLKCLAGAALLALGTIPLFDALLGDFSDYAIKLQASHPLDWPRALGVWRTPQGLLFLLASATTLATRLTGNPSPLSRAAIRVWLLTCGIGLTSLAAYAKHGGRENSLLPLALGATICLLLQVLAERESVPTRHESGLVVLAACLAVWLTPHARPVVGEARRSLQAMHEDATAWLVRGRELGLPLLSASISARIDAGDHAVPRDMLQAAAELALAHRPEADAFRTRLESGHYAGLLLTSSSLTQDPTLLAARPALLRRYVVTGPAPLQGHFPVDPSGYARLERAPAWSGPRTLSPKATE